MITRYSLFAMLCSITLLASCAPETASVPTTASASTVNAIPISHAPEIRIALIGAVTDANVWALFDTKGYSYNNYAVRSAYWPRLYHLSIPDRKFEAVAAADMPSAVQAEGSFYTATVPLRSDLNWSDGSPLTADDVAFTVNTALSFQLGFDWHDYYNPDWLDHAEAVDTYTVKFFFKQAPNVGVWQYGALQGPIVQKQYWQSKIADSVTLLPSTDLPAQIEALKAKVVDLQKQVDALNAALFTATGDEARQTQAALTRQQGDLDQAINDVSKAQTNLDTAFKEARESLYALNDPNEPRLGAWQSEVSPDGSDSVIENKANPKFPGAQANFDRAVYQGYATINAAMAALQSGKVDVILAPGDISSPQASGNSAVPNLMKSPTHSLRFLVFNPLSSAWKDAVVRQALACMIDEGKLADGLNGQAMSLDSFVLPQEAAWYSADAALPCQGLDSAGRLAAAVQLLKSAGYTWTQEPAGQSAGQELNQPSGQAFPAVSLLVLSSDNLRMTAATYIQQQARLLGLPLTAQGVGADEINYVVFSSHSYDLAIVGWKVSSYPSYLCNWFGDGNPFHYDESQIKSMCAALNSTSDLDAARQQVAGIQSNLAQALPFIPLYSDLTYDAYRNVTYPFAQVLDGLSAVYGAPSLAMPASP